ncbi:MAG: hypothetical protein NTW21_37840, partial [Verrucomicrobia bacterium]|nr:hypothetical protein [Verrucomicrobiota bacterium]
CFTPKISTFNIQLPTFNDQVRARHDTASALLPPANPCADDSRIRLKRKKMCQLIFRRDREL